MLLGIVQSWIYGERAWVPSLGDLSILGVATLYFAVFSTVSLAIFCVPLTAILSKYRIESTLTYPVAGFVVGMGVAALFFTPMYEPYTYEIFLFHLLCGAVPGAIAGAVWWRAYRSKRALNPSVR